MAADDTFILNTRSYIISIVVHGNGQSVIVAKPIAVQPGLSELTCAAVLNSFVNMSLVYDTF